MKKSVLVLNLIFLCSVISQVCSAQLDILAGPLYSRITGSSSWGSRIGFQAGAAYPVFHFGNEALSLRVEANLSLQGAGWDEGSYSGTTNLLYVNVPVVIRYLHSSGIFGEAGLQPGLLLSAKDKYDDGTTESFMDHMNALDISIPIGVGYMITEKLGVSLRVIPGISDISSDQDYTDRNLVIALRVSYSLPLGK